MDNEDNVSLPKETTVNQQAGSGTPDEYEDNDSYDTASWIGVDALTAQVHTFHDQGDQDWAQFYAEEDDWITIDTLSLGPDANTFIELFRDDGTSKIMEDDNSGEQPLSSTITWEVDTTGFYYVRVTNIPATVFGPNTQYDLRVWREIGPSLPGWIMGFVVEDGTATPIANAHVVLTDFRDLDGYTADNGAYMLVSLPARTYVIEVSAPGFHSVTESVTISVGGLAELDFQLEPISAADLDVSTNILTLTESSPLATFSIVNLGELPLSWAVESDTPGVTVDFQSGTGDQTITVTASDFTEDIVANLTVTNTDNPAESEIVVVEVRHAHVPADVNDDGSTNAIDVQLVINEALGLTVDYDCDINGDSSVDAIDVQFVINAVLGIDISASL